jgi:hypothetical protein
MNAPSFQSGRFHLHAAVAALAAALFVLLSPATARAAGNFSIKTPEVQENSGEWHVKVRIDLARAPSMMHTPMRFTFSKQVVDERAIMSKGAEPVHHRNVLDVAPKQIVSMDVDFADAGGKVFKSTYFEFDLARKDGYFEAGEYQVALEGPDGAVGGSQKLTLKGDNPPVYRGAMDFSDDKSQKKKGPKMENVSSGLDGGSQQVAQNDDGSGSSGSAAVPSGEVAASGEAGDMIPKSAFNKTAEEEAVQDHPKGCGCVAAGLGGGVYEDGAALGLGIAAAGLVLARRRRANGTRA